MLLMGFVAIAPIVLASQMETWPWKIGVVVVFLLAVAALWRQGVLLTRQDAERERREIERDKRFEEMAHTVLSSQHPSQVETPVTADSPLKDRVVALAHDLFAFLKERGPEPPDPINHLQSTDKQWKEVWERYDPYVERIHHDYLRLYRDRVVNIFHELAAQRIRIPDVQEWEIDPPQAVRAATVRKIAEQLLLLATRMD